jgi:hypothetical protein
MASWPWLAKLEAFLILILMRQKANTAGSKSLRRASLLLQNLET